VLSLLLNGGFEAEKQFAPLVSGLAVGTCLAIDSSAVAASRRLVLVHWQARMTK
jgi:hypothetical protein